MWKKALVGVPRVSKEQWSNLDVITRWLIATRASVLILTLVSSLMAGILASRDWEKFDATIFLLVVVGLLLAHATNNLLNDLTDWRNGVDKDNYFRNRYGTHPMSVMSLAEMMKFVLVTGISAAIVGLLLIYLRGEQVFYLTLSGAFFLLFYTWPLKLIGLGEISVFLVWGILMIGGGYYTITGNWNWDVCIASVPYALGTTSVIMGKHIDKLEEDLNKGIYTLPVILGNKLSRYFVLGMFISQYIFTIYLIFVQSYFSMIMLFTLLAIFTLPFKAYINPKPSEPPKNYPAGVWPLYYVAYSFRHNANFGCIFLGIIMLENILLYFGLRNYFWFN